MAPGSLTHMYPSLPPCVPPGTRLFDTHIRLPPDTRAQVMRSPLHNELRPLHCCPIPAAPVSSSPLVRRSTLTVAQPACAFATDSLHAPFLLYCNDGTTCAAAPICNDGIRRAAAPICTQALQAGQRCLSCLHSTGPHSLAHFRLFRHAQHGVVLHRVGAG